MNEILGFCSHQPAAVLVILDRRVLAPFNLWPDSKPYLEEAFRLAQETKRKFCILVSSAAYLSCLEEFLPKLEGKEYVIAIFDTYLNLKNLKNTVPIKIVDVKEKEDGSWEVVSFRPVELNALFKEHQTLLTLADLKIPGLSSKMEKVKEGVEQGQSWSPELARKSGVAYEVPQVRAKKTTTLLTKMRSLDDQQRKLFVRYFIGQLPDQELERYVDKVTARRWRLWARKFRPGLLRYFYYVRDTGTDLDRVIGVPSVNLEDLRFLLNYA